MSEWYELKVMAFDQPLIFVVRQLVQHSSLADKVTLNERNSILGTAKVLEVGVRHSDLSPEQWSAGEQMLWGYLGSLSGHSQVNLRNLTSFYAKDEEVGPWLVACFVRAMGMEGR